MADVEMADATRDARVEGDGVNAAVAVPIANSSNGTAAPEPEVDNDTEKKKALLVYKSNQPSASDDDDDDENDDEDDEEDDDDVDDDDDDDAAGPSGEDDDLDDVASVKSAGNDDIDDDDEGVQVEKDDDESINVPSDDDLDSTATPTRVDTDEDMASDKHTDATKRAVNDESDSASSAGRAASSSPTKNDGEGKILTLKSGTTSDVKAIIAARRRTGVRKECEVCGEPRNGRRAMLCANCKCMYHSSCYRQRFSKLINASGKQWFCPECESNSKAQQAAASDREASTPRKKRDDAGKARGVRGTKGVPAMKGKQEGDAHVVTDKVSASELELKRIKDVALRGGKKINAVILERTDEMLQVTQSLTSEIEAVMEPSWSNNDKPSFNAAVATPNQPPPFTLPIASSSSPGAGASILNQQPLSPTSLSSTNEFRIHGNGGVDHAMSGVDATERNVLLTRVFAGLGSLKNLLQQLQVTGIQFEVDLIKEIKMPPVKDEQKANTGASASSSSRKAPSSAAARGASNTAGKAKNGASRLYSSKQIQKLEEWYQKSSRPESCEIQAMYRIINSPDYADKELQPDGISVKQIRIWFDNRRAKERLDYMRLKMKDISTTDMDADSVKRMKAAYIDEAKEVLEARVSRLRENGKGPGEIVDEAGDLLLPDGEHPLPTKSTKASPATKSSQSSSGNAASNKDNAEGTSKALNVINQKKRIRIDYVASVRKTVKDAREAGKSEEEIKVLRTAAIERARERLHVPYKNSRQGPSKPLGKDEVTHIKLKMLKLLEEDAPAEEITDVIELLLSVMIPRDILIESALHRQLNLALKAHKDNKELVKQTNKLLDEFNTIIEKGDLVVAEPDTVKEETGGSKAKKKKDTSLLLDVDAESLPGTPGASPDSPAASPDSRRPRVKFSLEQLVKLEKHFHKDDTPSKKKLDKLAEKLNEIGAQDPASDEAQKSIDYKQIRCWFYKRRSTNQRPQALTTIDLQDAAGSSSSSSSETESDSEGSVSSKGGKPKAVAKRKAPSSADNKSPAAKRSKKDGSASGESKPKSSSSAATKKESSSSKSKDASSKHPGRIFNVKQLATIIEEYEKNPRPSVARLEELQNILNQGDHADENFVNPTGVTKRQIKTWFSNRRAKERLDLIKMKVQDKQVVGKSKSGKSKKTAATADSGIDSETEDEDRDETKKKKATKFSASASSANESRKELFVAAGATSEKQEEDDDVDSDDDDELSDAESEHSAPAAIASAASHDDPNANSNAARVTPSMRMLVDDDDDDSDDDIDSDDDDDDDDSDNDDA
ncbi:Homeobox and zinc-finger domain-containing protein, partial [Globisporangium splendens]